MRGSYEENEEAANKAEDENKREKRRERESK